MLKPVFNLTVADQVWDGENDKPGYRYRVAAIGPRLGASLAQHLFDVEQRLAHLSRKLRTDELVARIPADLSGDEHHAPVCSDAVGVAARPGPAWGLEDLHLGSFGA